MSKMNIKKTITGTARRAAALLTAAVLAVSIIGCGGSAGGSSSGSAGKADASAQTAGGGTEAAAGAEGEKAEGTAQTAEDKPLREMNVVLDWYPNAIHAPLKRAIFRKRAWMSRSASPQTTTTRSPWSRQERLRSVSSISRIRFRQWSTREPASNRSALCARRPST